MTTRPRMQGHTPLPRPTLMHSNLNSVDEVIATSTLPEAIRPSVLAFGTLADGFLPFEAPRDGGDSGREGDARASLMPRRRPRIAAVYCHLLR